MASVRTIGIVMVEVVGLGIEMITRIRGCVRGRSNSEDSYTPKFPSANLPDKVLLQLIYVLE